MAESAKATVLGAVASAVQHYRRIRLWFLGLRGGRRTYLPLMPWRLAAGAAVDGTAVAMLPGEQGPPVRPVFYGPVAPPPNRLLAAAPPARQLQITRYDDLVAMPHHILLARGSLLPATFHLVTTAGEPAMRPVGRNRHVTRLPWRLPAPVTVDEPVFLADCLFRGYGHTLLEIVPKLHVLSQMPGNVKVATSGMVLADAFMAFGVPQERLIQIRGPTFFKTAYVPDPPVTLAGRLHPVARAAFAHLGRIGEQSSITPIPRLFASRSQIAGRPLQNRIEVEHLFADYGFKTVRPEALSLSDQIRLFSTAGMIAGEGGSAMHNLVFARPEARALILSPAAWLSLADQAIAQQDGQLGFVLGAGVPEIHARDAAWWIDIGAVEAAIVRHFDLASRRSAGD
jgi:capsular polysaccharide biosynthesis protein